MHSKSRYFKFIPKLFIPVFCTGCFLFKKVESRSGYLEYTAGYCLLSRDLRDKFELVPCKDSDKLCKLGLETKLLGSTDGLNKNFCEINIHLVGKKISVEGIRVAGETILQNCSNRSCFDEVKILK